MVPSRVSSPTTSSSKKSTTAVPSKQMRKTTRKKTSNSKPKLLTRKQANALIIDSGIAIREAIDQLERVRPLAAKAGLSVDCTTLPKLVATRPTATAAAASLTGEAATTGLSDPLLLPAGGAGGTDTGGHSNTDHAIQRTGDERHDRLAELRRHMWRQHRAMQPEQRGDDRWDKPKRFPGERRRRITRDCDAKDAPSEPPLTGFILFLGQMTNKIRHDRPTVPHDQTKVMKEISKLWRIGMSEDDRQYYNQFANDAKGAFAAQMIEYRATGSFTPSDKFVKLPGVNIWVRGPASGAKNGLEEEILGYSQWTFPPRPPSMDEAYVERDQRGKYRRKLKAKGLLEEDGKTMKDESLGDFETLFQQHRTEQQAKQCEELLLEEDEEGIDYQDTGTRMEDSTSIGVVETDLAYDV